MAVVSHKITDIDSFNAVKKKPRQIAGLYFYYALDCLFDLATCVAKDFFKRPHLYTSTGNRAFPGVLAQLHAQLGRNERLPSTPQREEVFSPIFGATFPPDLPVSDFSRLRDELIQASTAFAERVFDTGVEMLRERVRVTHTLFKAYVTGFAGDSVEWSTDEAFANLSEKSAYLILRNERVAAIFGIAQTPVKAWPYVEDANGDKLVEEVSVQLSVMNGAARPITRERFTNLQRAAKAGAEAIATAIDVNPSATDDELDILITKMYTWGSALAGVEPAEAATEVPVSAGAPAEEGEVADWLAVGR
jgi:hypothetical protein